MILVASNSMEEKIILCALPMKIQYQKIFKYSLHWIKSDRKQKATTKKLFLWKCSSILEKNFFLFLFAGDVSPCQATAIHTHTHTHTTRLYKLNRMHIQHWWKLVTRECICVFINIRSSCRTDEAVAPLNSQKLHASAKLRLTSC